MEGEQIPKATMINFIKKKSTISANPQFISKMLGLAKEYIVRISDKANDVCSQQNKKTINNEHLEVALKNIGLDSHITNLRSTSKNLKDQHQAKLEQRHRIEVSLKEMMLEEEKMPKEQKNINKMVEIRDNFGMFPNQQSVEISDENYEEEEEEDNEASIDNHSVEANVKTRH